MPAPNEQPKLTLDQLIEAAAEREPIFIRVECISNETGERHVLDFVFEKSRTPYMRIKSDKRKFFLTTEREAIAEENLKVLANQIRQITGGVYSIHPFYGLVWDTRNATISEID